MNVNMNVNMKPTPGFCKRLGYGLCYRATDSAYLEDYRSSTTSFVGHHEIRNPDGVQNRWSSELVNNARLVVMVVVTFMPLSMYYTMP